MPKFAFTAFAGVLLFSMQTSSFAQDMMPENVKESGGMLMDSKGMMLYTYDNDKSPGKSSCTGQCSKNWPALVAPADAKPMGNWTIVARDDGSKQWAYLGKPLYTFVQDKKPGDMMGDGKGGGAWHMAMP